MYPVSHSSKTFYKFNPPNKVEDRDLRGKWKKMGSATIFDIILTYAMYTKSGCRWREKNGK